MYKVEKVLSNDKDNTFLYLRKIYYFKGIINDNYYIVILSKNKSNTLLEFNKINEEYDSINIEWRYKPSKRDGKN